MCKRLYIVLCASILLLATGCEKAPLSNKIEQHWKLEQFTILETNEVVKCERIFFGITRMVTVISEKQGFNNLGTFVATTEYCDGETLLVLKDFKVRKSIEDTSDRRVDATVEQLKPFGIINPNETIFKIVKSTHNTLVLESDYACLELFKF